MLGVGAGISVSENASFACTASFIGGDVYKSYSPEESPVELYEFSYPMTYEESQILKSDPKGLITFIVKEGEPSQGLIEDIKLERKNGIAKIKLISSRAVNR